MANYKEIKTNCLHSHKLWEDPDFPATQSSVFYHQVPPFQFEWKRPFELYPHPKLIGKGTEGFDAVTGSLGDEWLLSCFEILHMYKGLFFRVIPGGQRLNSNYAGIFRFCIWWWGQWVEVLVDDRLPVVNGKLAFMHCSHSEQMWPALLEKAYAKLHGSYEALKYGHVHDALVELTGGIPKTIPLRDLGEPANLQNLLQTTSIVTAYRVEKSENDTKSGTHFRIYDLVTVDTQTGPIHLVRLGKPSTPGDKSFNNLMIDKQTLWNSSLLERERLTSTDPGFWMLYTEFTRMFSQVDLVHIDGETSTLESTLSNKQKWLFQAHQGRWMKGVTAGGCKNHTDFFHMNPQIQLILNETDTVYISLNQHSIMEPKVIGFSIYKITTPFTEIAPATFFKKSSINSEYTNSRQVSERCELKAGAYLVIPTTFEPRQEGSFTLQVCSLQPLKMSVLDNSPRTIKKAFIKPPTQVNLNTFQLYDSHFLQIADEHKTINAFELQELLETCLPNDYIKSCATIETCRQVVLSMERDGLGRITLSDFKDLIYSLRYWQDVFKRHSTEKMGVLRVERFRDALQDVGFVVPERVMALLVLKFMRKDGMLRFGDFVSAIVLLHRAFDLFFSNCPSRSCKINLTFSEWLMLALTC